MWGGGADTRALFADCLRAVAADPAVGVTALAVDLVPEYDGDTSYVDAALDVAADTDGPLVVLTGLPAALDEAAADRLRAAGVPVLEGFRSGLLAMRHLLDAVARPAPRRRRPPARRPSPGRCSRRTASRPPSSARRSSEADVLAAAEEVGWPVVLKTAAPGITHRSDVQGVVLDVADADGRAGRVPRPRPPPRARP